jgi:phospholipid/cholesterol/gamma-HCH transport system ATP-binding protein
MTTEQQSVDRADTDVMIRFSGVSKSFGTQRILNGLDLDIYRGETYVVCGPSGVGKSVTLKHIVRLLTPDEGGIYVAGENVSDATGSALAYVRDKVGYLFQGGALLGWLSVAENVALPLREKTTLTEAEIRAKVARVLEMVELDQHGEKRPSEISGGMKKRAGLARAIVTDPEIVLYDEPTSGLDPVTSRTIDSLIHRLKQEIGVTSVVVTHDLHSALTIGDRIGMLHAGQLIESATPADFIESSQQPVQDFLSSQFITRKGSWQGEQA